MTRMLVYQKDKLQQVALRGIWMEINRFIRENQPLGLEVIGELGIVSIKGLTSVIDKIKHRR